MRPPPREPDPELEPIDPSVLEQYLDPALLLIDSPLVPFIDTDNREWYLPNTPDGSSVIREICPDASLEIPQPNPPNELRPLPPEPTRPTVICSRQPPLQPEPFENLSREEIYGRQLPNINRIIDSVDYNTRSYNKMIWEEYRRSLPPLLIDIGISFLLKRPVFICSNINDSFNLLKTIKSDYEKGNYYETFKSVASIGLSSLTLNYSFDKLIPKNIINCRSAFCISSLIEHFLDFSYRYTYSEMFDAIKYYFPSISDVIAAGLIRLIIFGIGGIKFKYVSPIIGITLPNTIISRTINVFFETKYEKEVLEAFNSLCLPQFQNRQIKDYIETIVREIYNGINIIDEMPFVSLHFNNNHLLYSVMHPYYKNTIVGNLLSFLDYFLKGFVNGGFFSTNFVKSWANQPPETRLVDLNQLNKSLIDIKKTLKTINKSKNYKTVYDIIGQDGIVDEITSAFRIIGEIELIETAEGFLFPKPYFSVEYDIHPNPLLKKIISEPGPALDEFGRINNSYFEIKEIIKNLMPQVPHFRGYFVILDIISFLIYYIQSLRSIGKCIDTPNAFQITDPQEKYVETIPEVFPPLPVTIRQRINPNITTDDIFDCIKDSEINKEIED